MNWRRVYTTDNDPQHFKEWRGGRGQYKIVWRDRVYDVTVPPAYQVMYLEKGTAHYSGS
jgi:hypothetical protein